MLDHPIQPHAASPTNQDAATTNGQPGMAHGAHGASGWVSSDNQPDWEHEGVGTTPDHDHRRAERNSRPGVHRSRSRRRHVLQRARSKLETLRPAAGFELVKEKLTQLEEKQDQDTVTNGAWELCAILRRLTREVGATDLRLHRVSAGIREHNHA